MEKTQKAAKAIEARREAVQASKNSSKFLRMFNELDEYERLVFLSYEKQDEKTKKTYWEINPTMLKMLNEAIRNGADEWHEREGLIKAIAENVSLSHDNAGIVYGDVEKTPVTIRLSGPSLIVEANVIGKDAEFRFHVRNGEFPVITNDQVLAFVRMSKIERGNQK